MRFKIRAQGGKIMKRTITFLMLAIAVLTPAQTEKKGPEPGTDATSKVLIDLEEKWVAALEKSDVAALDAILADTYVETDGRGHRSDKQALLVVVKSGDLKVEFIRLSEMQVYVYGDAAVVIGSAADAGSYKGQPFTANVSFTETFVRQNGKWTAVASHRSVVA
jgi:ketosteroid isomerase-like protein